MVATLTEGMFEIIPDPTIYGDGDGVTFGGPGHPIMVEREGFDPGSSEMRAQTAERPHGDGNMSGRDYLGPPTITLKLDFLHGTDVRPIVDELHAAWQHAESRRVPGSLSVLRWREGGVTYRALGRGVDFGRSPQQKRNVRRAKAVATFRLERPEYYIEEDSGSANRRRLTLRQVGPPIMTGMRFPSRFPWRFGGSTRAERIGEVTVGGYLPAPMTITIFGPPAGTAASGFKVSGDGWEIETSASLAYDRSLIIRTAQATFTHENGRTDDDLMESLTHKSRLTARLQPGHQIVKFEVASDPTGSAYAVIDWWDTVPA